MMRQNTEIIVSRVTTNFGQRFDNLQLEQASTITTIKKDERKYDRTSHKMGGKQHKTTALQRRHLNSSKAYTPSWTGRFSMTCTSTKGAWQAYLQLPDWLSPSIHTFQSYPTRSGWSFNYRVYNVVAHDSEIIMRIQNGDKNGVLELFDNRQASPFDKDADGASLLYVSLRSMYNWSLITDNTQTACGPVKTLRHLPASSEYGFGRYTVRGGWPG